MKRSLLLSVLLSAALLGTSAAFCQTDTSARPGEDNLHPDRYSDSLNNNTSDDSLHNGSAKHYQTFPAPNFGRHYIGALGSYTTLPETSATEQHIAISGDEENPGKIWISGLAGDKIFALRKKEAGTYKIPAQKAGDRPVQEGTLIYDDSTREINICLGCPFNDDNPADAFSQTGKSTGKQSAVVRFTGVKTDSETAALKN